MKSISRGGLGGGTASLPARVAWIEIKGNVEMTKVSTSLPARVAWIEIISHYSTTETSTVATREGSVD